MGGYYSTSAVSDQECITGTACPFCKAAKGSPCVYAMPREGSVTEIYARRGYASSLAQLRRAGKPTKRVHPERRDIMRRRKWAAIARAHRPEVTPTPEHLRASWRAMLAFDQRENEQLRRWLLLWGDMFQSSNNMDKPTGRV